MFPFLGLGWHGLRRFVHVPPLPQVRQMLVLRVSRAFKACLENQFARATAANGR